MSKIDFIKYQGAGNDFVMIDGIAQEITNEALSQERVALLCHRNFGIGADGLIVLRKHPDYDFEMVYFNRDGQLSSMCGNGGRCILHMASSLGYLEEDNARFLAVDGPHEGIVKEHNQVELMMSPVSNIETVSSRDFFLDTGSPHYVRFVDQLKDFDIIEVAREIRYGERFHKEGTNVNFVEVLEPGNLAIRTYERGVEGETLACGTGVVAAALAYDHLSALDSSSMAVKALGGDLQVKFNKTEKGYTNIWLIGPAKQCFKGSIAWI